MEDTPLKNSSTSLAVGRCKLKLSQFGAGEMAPRLRALAATPEVLSSNPSNHMVAHNHEIRCPLLVCLMTATVYSYTLNK